MKKNFYQKLAWDAIRKNKRMYFPYFLTGIMMVMMFYILMSLMESPTVSEIRGGSVLMDILPLGCCVIAIFSLLFLFYTNAFLMKQRYREFALYHILGMDKKNIGKLIVWETIDTVSVVIGIGLVSGIVLYKAVELVLLNIMNVEISFSISIGITSMVLTALIYSGIYAILLINALIKIYRSNPLELMQSSRAGGKEAKMQLVFCNCRWCFAWLCVLSCCQYRRTGNGYGCIFYCSDYGYSWNVSVVYFRFGGIM